jgi:hypothetical protein
MTSVSRLLCFLAGPYNRLWPYISNMYIRDMILFLQFLWHVFINNFTYGKSELPKVLFGSCNYVLESRYLAYLWTAINH